MADHEYVVQILSTPVFTSTLKEWALRTERDMTDWNGQLQGSKSFSFNLSVPMMFMASQSSSQGWNRAFTDADSVSYSEGETFGVSEGESVGTSLVVFLILFSAFICTWVVKAQSPVNRPDSDVNMSDYADSVGWVSDKSTMSSKWILDPEIPDNYRRVTGNIYAVLNEHGVVIVYKERRMKDKKYVWVDTSAPEIKKINGQTSSGDNRPKEDHKDPSPKISQNPSGGANKTEQQTRSRETMGPIHKRRR